MAADARADALHRVREALEAREAALSPFAARGATSRGRERPEPPPLLRTEYQRDRDRILHSKSFRRLKHKTQVFIAPAGDHFVTRLTHTLEVAQIARTIARALTLNEDLTEAAALGHDIGHAPFGHAGEQALAEALGSGWRHNEHGLRVVERVENNGRGLNLMWETREAILKSSKLREDIFAEAWGTASTLEGQIVKVADAVAYVNHDIADAIRAGLLREEDLPDRVRRALGRSHHDRIETLVVDIVTASWAATGELGLDAGPVIQMSPSVLAAANELRDFLFERIYLPEDKLRQVHAAKETVRFLLAYFRGHPDEIPSDFGATDDPPQARAVDYVAGMTDRFALRIARALGCEAAVRYADDGR
jgi:dGTPase